MARKEALEKCLKLWTLLEETGDWSKQRAYDKLELEEDSCSCPICQYMQEQEAKINKVLCWEDCIIDWKVGHCNKEGSPYYNWTATLMEEDPAARKLYAGQVRKLVEEAIGKLKQEGTNNGNY